MRADWDWERARTGTAGDAGERGGVVPYTGTLLPTGTLIDGVSKPGVRGVNTKAKADEDLLRG